MQCGFRPGRSTTDQISLSRKLLRNIGTSTHALSTYDRVPREKICGLLREHCVDGRLLLAVKSLYS